MTSPRDLLVLTWQCKVIICKLTYEVLNQILMKANLSQLHCIFGDFLSLVLG